MSGTASVDGNRPDSRIDPPATFVLIKWQKYFQFNLTFKQASSTAHFSINIKKEIELYGDCAEMYEVFFYLPMMFTE